MTIIGCGHRAHNATIRDYENTVQHNPFVRHVRAMLDKTEHANGSETCGQSGIIGVDPQVCGDFIAVARDHIGQKLLLLEVNQAVGGGLDMAVVFRGHPGTIYYVWVYQGAEGDFDLRAFQPMSVNDEHRKRALELYQSALEVERWWF